MPIVYVMRMTAGSWCLRMALLFATSISAACSPAGLLNRLTPSDTYQRAKNLPYGPYARQTLDVYQPKALLQSAPVVVFFYGGDWQQGSKDDYLFVAEALVSRGFIVVIPDYRLYPEVRYPAFLQDGAAAVSWTLDHVAGRGRAPQGVHLMGHSAGAYIAAMLALDDRWLGADRARVRSVAGLAGPYDFLPLTDPARQIIFGTAENAASTQPITFVDQTAPPFLLLSGDSDRTVRPGNSQRLAAQIRATGGSAVDRYYRDISHVGLIGTMARPLRFLAPTLDDVTGFWTAQDRQPQ